MTLRMTLGTAAAARSRRATHWQRSGSAQKVEARIGRHQRAVDDDLQPEVREDVHDRARHRPPVGAHGRGAQRFLGRRQQIAPRRAGHLEHAAEQARLGALAQQHVAVLAQGDEGEADALRALGAFAGAAAATRRCRARAAAQSLLHAGTRGTTDAAACRCRRRDPSSPARSRRRARAGVSVAARRFNSGLAAGSGWRTANRRATTRSMLPSTGVADSPKAMAAMAAAV